MGNTGSSKRDRVSSESESPASPSRDKAFEFCIGAGIGKYSYQQIREGYDDVPAVFQDKVSDSNSSTSTESIPSHDKCFPTVFKWDGGGKEVFIVGTFSNWKPIPMVKSESEFGLIVDIPEGEHQYKFLVDGKWMHAPKQNTVDNDMGTKNNLILVKKSDCEVFQALADDIIESSKGSAVPGNFSQDIPQFTDKDRAVRPPLLPPHLKEVILNKEVSLNIEPTLLPMPNHVMLNHLYALCIKDRVMVLSGTLRFRKKYITTILYKPQPIPAPNK